MKLYSDYPGRRTRQIVADLLALTAIGLWVWLGVFVFGLVEQLAGFGRQMEDAGAGFRETMEDIGITLGGVPLIGGGIRAPFDGASSAGQALETAGQQQQDAVLQLAIGLGVALPALPILMILVLWLVPRIRFITRAGRARRALATPTGVDLLALRALATGRLSDIAAVDADALGAWRRGEPAVLRRLAALELRESGVRLRS